MTIPKRALLPKNDLDETTSTTDLEINKNTKPFKPVEQAYLKALIKITRQRTKANHHHIVLNEALAIERPPRRLTPNIRHNIPKPPVRKIQNIKINQNYIAHFNQTHTTRVHLMIYPIWRHRRLIKINTYMNWTPITDDQATDLISNENSMHFKLISELSEPPTEPHNKP